MNRLAVETQTQAMAYGIRDVRLHNERRLQERRLAQAEYESAVERRESARRIRSRRAIESALAAKLDSAVTDWQARYVAARQA